MEISLEQPVNVLPHHDLQKDRHEPFEREVNSEMP